MGMLHCKLTAKELVFTANNIKQQPGVGLTLASEDLDPRIGCDSRIRPIEETKTLELSTGKTLKLGIGLSHKDQDLIETTLKNNANLFAWSAADLSSVDPQVTIHKLSIFRKARYVS